MPSIFLSHVTKQFPSSRGPQKVLKDITFTVPEGGVLCLLGPNGSGKTTLLKTISSLLSPDAGDVRLDALNVHEHPQTAKRLIGFASTEDHSFYGRLSVRLNLWFYAQLHGLSRGQWTKQIAVLGEQLELTPILDRPFRELSNGQKQRILLARALLHDPPVLLLDEPHQNLDPHFSMRLRELLIEEWGKRRRKTIVVSTHHLEDARKISEQWVILTDGVVRFCGSLEEVRRENPAFSVESFFREMTLAPETAAGPVQR